MPRSFKALPDAPVADRRPAAFRVHGVELRDDYAWLRAPNWQEAMREPERLPSDIAAYLTAENAYYETAMADTAALQQRLIEEMRGRIKEDDSSVPRLHGPYAYASRYAEGAEYPVLVRMPKEGGAEQVLLDVNAEAVAQDYFQLGQSRISPDHRTLAWSADVNGSEFHRLSFRDVETGRDLGYRIEDVASVAWADAHTLFYVRVDARHHPNKVYRHRLGSDPAEDVLVYTESDTRYGVHVQRLRSGGFVAISTGMNDENEIHVIPTGDPEAAPRVIEPRTKGLEYEIEQQGDAFLILTNADEAFDFKVMTAPVATPSRAHWAEVLPHEPGRMIVSLAAHENWTIWLERRDALPRICHLRRGRPLTETRAIAFDEEAYALGTDPSPDYDTDRFRFTYSSPTTPPQVYAYDLSRSRRVTTRPITSRGGSRRVRMTARWCR